MKRVTRYLTIIMLFLSVSYAAVGNETSSIQNKSYQKLSASYIVGAQVYNDNFLYNPGYNIQFVQGYKVSKELHLGAGAGFTKLTKERFVPLYAEAIGFKSKKQNSPFIKFQGGYSLGWIDTEEHQQGYEMRGGLYFNAGVGRKFKINNELALLLELAYSHQYGKLDYEVFGGETYTSELNYEMVWFTLGLMTL